MFQSNSRRIHLLFVFFTIKLTLINGTNRENLALRHPCNSINKRLEPYIKWTEKLASSQYGVVSDACNLVNSDLSCCTTEVVNSYGQSLSEDLKILFDGELTKLILILRKSKENIDHWRENYVAESRDLTKTSLEKLFSFEEYHLNVHHSVTNLFNVLADRQSSDKEVSKSSMELFRRLIISMYRRFMSIDSSLKLDEQLEKCLLIKAFDIEALPTQRELLYTLTSGASLINILETLFVYLDADIQRLSKSATIEFHPCVQRYARETLCPICLDSTNSLTNENEFNAALCLADCRFLVNNCFDQTRNPYITFATLAQSYSEIIKQIQESIVELKLVERLSKVHIYLYDMVVNGSNTEQTYTKLQKSCPSSNSKTFSPLVSVEPIFSERRDVVERWNETFHFLLENLQSSIGKLKESLIHEVSKDICENSKYADRSDRCTQIDKTISGNFSQWPSFEVSDSSTLSFDLTGNQIEDLTRKLTSVQQIVESLRPRKKFSFFEFVPRFESFHNEFDSNETETNSNVPFFEAQQNSNDESFSEQIYKQIDGQTTRRPTTKIILISNKGKILSFDRRKILIFIVFFLFFNRILDE